MSEAMALERMAQSLAELKGYLTSTRVPFLAKRTGKGETKTGNQPGDLDVVGLAPRSKGSKLLVIECKGCGGPKDYENWFKPNRLIEIDDMVKSAAGNIKKVCHARWDIEFKKKHHKPDQVWVIFPGAFYFTRKTKANDKNNDFVMAMQKTVHKPAGKGQKYEKEHEKNLLKDAEKWLCKRYHLQDVKLKPVHYLLRELFILIPRDMMDRQRRYPDTAMEMIRWMARAIDHEVLDLSEVQQEIRNAIAEHP